MLGLSPILHSIRGWGWISPPRKSQGRAIPVRDRVKSNQTNHFFFRIKQLVLTLTLSLTGIARPWLLRGGADSAPPYNSMKEGTETKHYYLEFGPLSKWRSHAKIWVPISKIERDFKIFRKFWPSWKKIIFWQKRLPFSQFLIFFALVFCKQSYFYSV